MASSITAAAAQQSNKKFSASGRQVHAFQRKPLDAWRSTKRLLKNKVFGMNQDQLKVDERLSFQDTVNGQSFGHFVFRQAVFALLLYLASPSRSKLEHSLVSTA